MLISVMEQCCRFNFAVNNFEKCVKNIFSSSKNVLKTVPMSDRFFNELMNQINYYTQPDLRK